MPIKNKQFLADGKEPLKSRTQYKIVKILKANPSLAFSTKDIEEIFNYNVRRQGIVQAITSLENKGIIVVGMIKEDKRHVMYVTIKNG